MTSQISNTKIKIGATLVAALMATTALTSVMTATAPANAGQPVVVQTNLPGSFSDLVEKTRPAVVSVLVKKHAVAPNMTSGQVPEQFKEFFQRFKMPGGSSKNFKMPSQPHGHSMMGQGSGFFISEDGYIVTNNHVIDGAKEIKVRLHDKRTMKAKLIGTDPKTDLAVLKVDGKDFKFVQFGNSDTTKVGDWVVAVGNPFGLSGTATAGIVSARGRDIGSGSYDDFIQIDASINRGNSGGPAFNRRGEVVGVNTAIFSPTGGSVGIGFAVPSNIANEVVGDLMKHGKVKRGWLGVMIQSISEDLADTMDLKTREGALVSTVAEASPASTAGLKAGDVVIGVGGKAIKSPRDLSKAIAAAEPGRNVDLKVLRDGTSKTMTVALKELEPTKVAAAGDEKDAHGKGKLGLMLKETDEGVVVAQVQPGSPAADKGIRSGDIIAKIAGQAVTSVADVQDAVKKAGGERFLMLVKNKKGARFLVLKPAKSVG
jgi:serine protease Do